MDPVTLGMAKADLRKARLAGQLGNVVGNRLLPFGDSISYMDSGLLSDNPLKPITTAYQNGSNANGMYAWAQALLGARMRMAGNAGVPGHTTAQMLARISTDVLAIPSDIVGVMGGANDWTQTVPAATTIANLYAIYDAIRGSGRRVLALTTMSRSSQATTDGRLWLSTVNAAVKAYARTRPGVILADVAAVVTDPATGVPYNGTPFFSTSDGTHPNGIGAMLAGQVIANALRPHYPANDLFSTHNFDDTNLSRNPCMLGTGGTKGAGITGTVGNLWNVSQASGASGTAVAAASKVARTDNLPGEWTRLTIDPTNTSVVRGVGTCTWPPLVAGDVVRCGVEVRATGLTGVKQFAGGSFAPGYFARALNGTWQQAASGWAIPDGVYVLESDAVMAAGATYLQVLVDIWASGGTLDIGRSYAYKL